MKQKVMLSVQGKQSYMGQEPDRIELVTEGEMEYRDGGWDISYEESDLTGMKGVTTTFRVEPEKITLIRSGALRSQMVFSKDLVHESLYSMDFGALLIRVCATHLFFDLTPDGGIIDLVYTIEIENAQAGVVDYHLNIRTIQE